MRIAKIIVLTVIGSFIFGVLLFNYVIMPLWVDLHEETTVPDVCGKTLEEAEEVLKGFKLKTKIVTQKFSSLPKGIVLSQNPLPTRRVKKGRLIELSISKGEEKVKVPWLEGLTLTQAQNLLLSSGLKGGTIKYQYSKTIEEGRVISTDPPSDSLVILDTEVSLLVSQGRPGIYIPDLTGKILKEAQEIVQELGLNLKVEYTTEPSTMGIVILQSPGSGTTMRVGDTINLIVGPPAEEPH